MSTEGTIISFDLIASAPNTCHANQCGSRGRLTMNDNELSLSAFGHTYTWKYTGGILYFSRDGLEYQNPVSLVGYQCDWHYINENGDGWTISNCEY
jgi:hypothetical protein